MAEEDIQPLVCDNGTGMVKVMYFAKLSFYVIYNVGEACSIVSLCCSKILIFICLCFRLGLLGMMLHELYFLALLAVLVTLV